MGLDLTIYMAKRGTNADSNPFMPDPPHEHYWGQIYTWRNSYELAHALAPGAGSPEWRTLTQEDADRAILAVQGATHQTGETLLTLRVLRLVREYIQEGRVFLIEVLY